MYIYKKTQTEKTNENEKKTKYTAPKRPKKQTKKNNIKHTHRHLHSLKCPDPQIPIKIREIKIYIYKNHINKHIYKLRHTIKVQQQVNQVKRVRKA